MEKAVIVARLRDAARIVRMPPPDSVNKLKFYLGSWGEHSKLDHAPLQQQGCGTTACAWGKIAIYYDINKTPGAPRTFWTDSGNGFLMGQRLGVTLPGIYELGPHDDLNRANIDVARAWFGIDDDEGFDCLFLDQIFFPDKYPVDPEWITEEMAARRLDKLADLVEASDWVPQDDEDRFYTDQAWSEFIAFIREENLNDR